MKTLLAITALFTLMLIGCGGDASQTPGSPKNNRSALKRVKAAGKLVIAYADEEPFGYLDTENDRVTGEAPEIARVVAERLGIKEIEPVLTEWKSLIPGLKAGRFDCIAAGMYITPDRARNVAFSNPTYRIGEAFIVKKGNPEELHSFKDVADHANAKLGFVRGTVERGYARKSGIPDDRVVTYPDPNAAIAGLQSGQVDAFVGTALTVQTLMSKLGDDAGLERAHPFEQPVIDGKTVVGYGAFAFRPEDTDLRDAFNGILKDYLGTDEHKKLVAPFGFLETEMTNGKTAEQVLAEKAGE